MYYGDMLGLKGKVRQLYGWGIIFFSDIALGGGDSLRDETALHQRSGTTTAG